MYKKCVWFILFFGGSLSSFAQVVPAATEGHSSQWSFGGGMAGFNPDLGHERLYGGTLWVDYSLAKLSPALRGAAVELEGRDMSLDHQRTSPVLRLDTVDLGATYTLDDFHGIRLYAKLLSGLGNADYLTGLPPRRYNQSRTVTSFGGGLEYLVYRRIWVRLDYEYQYFPDFFYVDTPKQAPLDPQGFTVGAVYRFSRRHRADE